MNPKRLITTVKTIPTHSPALRPYKNESTLNLINSLTVFQLCAVPPLVKHFPNFVKLAKATGTTPILNGVVKNTFFKHFCGN
ncbi:hypothetical protein BC833DRAFT_17385 [Globomyces pollinis-pini]|nr:hypothetical protein BC833DRAFT_17385 [Globomyces pollinis-pini]